MPRFLKDSKLILFSWGKKKTWSFSCERGKEGDPRLVLPCISTSSCRFRLTSRGPHISRKLWGGKFLKCNYGPSLSMQIIELLWTWETSIRTALLLFTKKGINKRIFHHLWVPEKISSCLMMTTVTLGQLEHLDSLKKFKGSLYRL